MRRVERSELAVRGRELQQVHLLHATRGVVAEDAIHGVGGQHDALKRAFGRPPFFFVVEEEERLVLLDRSALR